MRLNFMQRTPFFISVFGGSLIIISVFSMLAFFWTDVVGVNPALVSVFLMITKCWDAINDPIIGYISDRTQTKYGRYRPWVLTCVPTAVFGLLTFTKLPGVSDTAAGWFSMIMYFLFVLSATCGEVPGQGLVAATTTDFRSRGQIMTFRMCGTFSAAIIVGALLVPMVIAFGGAPNSPRGFFITILIFTVIAIPFGLVMFFGTKERVRIPVSKHKIGESFGALKGNGPFWIFFWSFLSYGVTSGATQSRMYYWTTIFGDAGPMAMNMTAWAVGQVVGAAAYFFLVKKVKNKKDPVVPSFLVTGVIYVLMFWYPIGVGTSGGVIAFYNFLTFLTGATLSVALTGMYGILPDLTEYTQWKYRYRISGFVSSILNCSYKWGLAIGVAAFMMAIAAVGYAPELGPGNGEGVKISINLFMHTIPGLCHILAGLILTRYKLDMNTLESMRAEIAARDDTA